MPIAGAGSAAATLGPSHAQSSSPEFLRAAFDSAQQMWREKFSSAGLDYEDADLVLFHAHIHSACGPQSGETGPFYCPADRTVYLNTRFFAALERAHGLQGPFAAGYVTAHEVGHHVQQLLGLHRRVAMADARDPAGANRRSIAVELQADCYAGVWLHGVAANGALSPADVRDILTAAAIVGDDFQRNRAGVDLAPETWTHGSSEQRVTWLTRGKTTGRAEACNSFAGA